jgi:hypothetical protein
LLHDLGAVFAAVHGPLGSVAVCRKLCPGVASSSLCGPAPWHCTLRQVRRLDTREQGKLACTHDMEHQPLASFRVSQSRWVMALMPQHQVMTRVRARDVRTSRVNALRLRSPGSQATWNLCHEHVLEPIVAEQSVSAPRAARTESQWKDEAC